MSGYREIWQDKPDLDKLPKGDICSQRAILLDKRLVALPKDFNGVKDDEETSGRQRWSCIRVKVAV